MPPDIELVPSPRPEPGQEPPLPTYHELLNTLCDEFNVPGSPTFSEAIKHIKDHYLSTTKKFINWCVLEGHGSSPNALALIEEYSATPEGRRRIAESYIIPAQQRLNRALFDRPEARRLALIIETLIGIFPEFERFTPPLITLREVLIDLYGFLSPNYELVSEPNEVHHFEHLDRLRTTESDGELTYERIQQVAGEQEAEYTGPRPTRFEHLFDED
jgi:hypothetical protein